VSFEKLFRDLVTDTTQASLPAFGPELAICGTIIVMLLLRVFNLRFRGDAIVVTLIGSCVGLYLAAPWIHLQGGSLKAEEIFTGLLIYDKFTIYFRALLLFFALLFVLFTWLSGIPDREDGPDFYALFLGATLGMCLMASANHLAMIFIAVEMASVPSYALAGMLKGRRQSSEAALKYSIYGAGAAGVMLYGISLLAGVLGTAHLPTMAVQLADLIASGGDPSRYMVLALGGLMLGAGLAFKLSAVPFHFWCPDVFEGASAEVNAFLSVASKAAALALLVRVAVGFGHVDAPTSVAAAPHVLNVIHTVAAQVEAPAEAAPAENETATDPVEAAAAAADGDHLQPVRNYLLGLVTLLSAITCTLGNLAAYGQTNIKRLLAYSTIAHAGYLMMPVAAAVALTGSRPAAAEEAVSSLCAYVGAYLFMNLGAFAVVAFVRNEIRSEEIEDYAGMIRRSPTVAICFSIILLSLLGLPPLVGFVAKVAIFYALADAELWLLFAIGGLNTFFSLFYYLRVVKVMVMEPAPAVEARPMRLSFLPAVYLAAVTAPIVILFVAWDGLMVWARQAASQLLS
jgi:NADH-quinone oxidoreductase subunit N